MIVPIVVIVIAVLLFVDASRKHWSTLELICAAVLLALGLYMVLGGGGLA